MNVLEISHVKKRFGEREVLRDLSFSVGEHRLFGFVGQNGAGKTTTMKIILGLLDKDGGEARVNGEPVRYGQTATNRFTGYLPDIPEFYSFMTPMEYLMFCGDISGMDKKRAAAKAEELLSLVGLSGEKRRVKGFSRGMKQRLGVAQALLNEPRLLICDEPTSALDPVGRKEILDILVSAKQYAAVVFSTHILTDVEHICDEIAFLHNGSIVLQGSIDEVKEHHKAAGFEIELERPRDAERLLGLFPGGSLIGRSHLLFENGGELESVMRALLELQIPFLRLEKREPSLEALFLEVAGK